MNYVDYMLDNADIHPEFEYDIVDEYDDSVETIQMPVNYKIEAEEEKVYIISINTKGLGQHKKTQTVLNILYVLNQNLHLLGLLVSILPFLDGI